MIFLFLGTINSPPAMEGCPKGEVVIHPNPPILPPAQDYKKLGPTKRRAKVKAMYANQFLLPKVRLKTKTDLGIITIPGGSIGRNKCTVYTLSPPSKYRPKRWYNWGLRSPVSWPNVFYTLLKPCGWCRCRSGYSAYPLSYLPHCSSDHSKG